MTYNVLIGMLNPTHSLTHCTVTIITLNSFPLKSKVVEVVSKSEYICFNFVIPLVMDYRRNYIV